MNEEAIEAVNQDEARPESEELDSVRTDEPSAKEKTRRLLEEVQGLKPVFIGIIDFCRERRRAEECDERYRELTEFNFCTFSPVRVRAMLEEAGALVYVEPEADAKDSESTVNIEAEDRGVDEECYEITERPEGWWLATEDGLAVIDAIDPIGDLNDLLGFESEFRWEYIKLMQNISETPMSIGELQELLQNDAPMVEHRRYAAALVKRLEDRGIAEFRGKWTLTDNGRKALELLVQAGVESE